MSQQKNLEKKSWSPDAIAISICLGGEIYEPLIHWWNNWRHVKAPISARELINEGWKPGPKLGSHLNKLREIKLDEGNHLTS